MKEKEKKLKVLLVYPNLPLMLVPPLSMAIFTKLLKQIILKLLDKPSFPIQEKFSKTILHPYVNYKQLIDNGYLVNSIISLAVISPLRVCKIERFLSKTKVVGIPVQLNCDNTMSDSSSSSTFL